MSVASAPASTPITTSVVEVAISGNAVAAEVATAAAAAATAAAASFRFSTALHSSFRYPRNL